MNDLKCLSEQELSEFVQGRIDELRVEQIAEHLEACDGCQATVVMLGERSDTFVDQLRTPAKPDALEAESACQVAVARLAGRATGQRSGPPVTLLDIGEIEQLGPYRIQGQLGVGGMGAVFEAVHTKLKRTVALKILPASLWTNPLAIARFEREMEIIGQLDHPNIVRASDAGEENRMHYLVMEHVDGLDLSRVANRVGLLAIADACEIGRQAAIGLQYANENHLVHRDIKPSNLMLAKVKGQDSRVKSQSGSDSFWPSTLDPRLSTSVKILDLGLALLGEAHSAHENELTTVGQLMGTLDYMSPEQGMDSHEVDIRADIYSLGATLFKLLTGRAPFAAPQYDTLLKKVTALANKPVTPIKQLCDDISDELASIIDRMLAKEPAERFSSPHEVAAALEPFARGADLGRLLLDALNAKEPEARPQPPVIRPVGLSPTPLVTTKPALGKFRSGVWNVAGLLVVLVLLAFAAGTVIHIATDNGELIVRAEEDAKIVVRKDGNTVRQLEVSKGDHTITVRSGGYEVELQGKSDELMVSQNNVTVKRGEQVVVHVQQRPKAGKGLSSPYGTGMSGGGDMYSGMAGMMGAGMDSGMASMYGSTGSPAPSRPATFDGKTYSQWLAELRTERKPERLTEAIRAFASLGEGDEELAAQSASVIMQIMRRNGAYGNNNSPQGKLNQQAHTVMLQMPGEIAVNSIEAELRDGNTLSRGFCNLLLGNAIHGYGSPTADFVSAVDRHRKSLYEILLTLPDDETASIRATAISLVIDHATAKRIELDRVEGLVARLQATLEQEDLELVAVGTTPLVELDPDNKKLGPALLRLLASSDHGQRVSAARSLGRLGARSHAAVAPLIETIRPLAEPNANSSGGNMGGADEMYGDMGAIGGGGGFGGGGFGGPGMAGGGMMEMYGGMGGYAAGEDIYYVVIEALGNIGPAAKAALPVLRKIAARKTSAATPGGEEGGFGPAGGMDMYGAGGMGGPASNYAGVAKAAIAKIEGKPIDHAAEPPALPDGIDLR